MEIIQDIKPSDMDSAYVEELPFDRAKKALEEEGYRVSSLEESALLRMQYGKDSSVSRKGNWTGEAFVYDPKRRLLCLTKSSPIMENPTEATQANREGNEYFLTNVQVQRALEDSVEVNSRGIPTGRFGEDELTAYAFGDAAENYGLFLRGTGIKLMPIHLPDLKDEPKDEPFARQVWFGYLRYFSGRSSLLSGRSSLYGYSRSLANGGRLRGVRKNFSTGTKG